LETNANQQRRVVLVAEDEPLLLLDALAIAIDNGFDAIGAPDADAAVRILESRDDILVIFTDINMPGSIDGLKLAHAVRNRWPPIRIIVTSAIANEQALPEGSLFIPKPYSASAIATLLHAVAV
jgi:CheY-like chemotaxis protein